MKDPEGIPTMSTSMTDTTGTTGVTATTGVTTASTRRPTADNEPGAVRSVRRVLTHLIAETSQHAGHADILHEALDGQRSSDRRAGPASSRARPRPVHGRSLTRPASRTESKEAGRGEVIVTHQGPACRGAVR